MNINVSLTYFSNDIPVLHIGGELDLASLEKLQKAVDSLTAEGYSQLVFALDGVSYMDSSALRLFLETRQKLLGRGGKLHIMNPSPRVLRVLSITRLLNSFSIVGPEVI